MGGGDHGLAFQGAFADLLFDAEANRTAADFVRGKRSASSWTTKRWRNG